MKKRLTMNFSNISKRRLKCHSKFFTLKSNFFNWTEIWKFVTSSCHREFLANKHISALDYLATNSRISKTKRNSTNLNSFRNQNSSRSSPIDVCVKWMNCWSPAISCICLIFSLWKYSTDPGHMHS